MSKVRVEECGGGSKEEKLQGMFQSTLKLWLSGTEAWLSRNKGKVGGDGEFSLQTLKK